MGKLKEFIQVGKEVRKEDLEEKNKEKVDNDLKKEIKKEIFEDTKDSLKIFGLMGGISIFILGIVALLIFVFVPKPLTKLLDKYLTSPPENTESTDTVNTDTGTDQVPDSGDGDITGSPAITADDKIDCTKPFTAIYITDTPVREEVSFSSDGSYNRLVNNTDGYIGTYTINKNVLSVSELSSNGESSATYTISKNCNEITRVEGNKKIVLKKE